MRFVITFDEHRASRICRIPRFIGARNHRVFYILEGRDIDDVFILLLHRESRCTVVRSTNGKFIARLSARTTSTREFSASSRTGATRRCSPFAFVNPRVVPPLSLSFSICLFFSFSLSLPPSLSPFLFLLLSSALFLYLSLSRHTHTRISFADSARWLTTGRFPAGNILFRFFVIDRSRGRSVESLSPRDLSRSNVSLTGLAARDRRLFRIAYPACAVNRASSFRPGALEFNDYSRAYKLDASSSRFCLLRA